MLDISLLGGLRLAHEGVALRTPISARLQSLIGHLVIHRRTVQPRSYLAGLLWPDSPPERSRANLRRLLHELRGVLPSADRFVHFGEQAVGWRLDAPYTLDVDQFEMAVADGSLHALRSAVDLYRGDLLPACYDDWILPERERLRQARDAAHERLTELLEGAREYGEAVAHARRLLAHDPLREESYRLLMRLCALNGDRAGIVRAYRECAAALGRELGVEPSQLTRELFDRLRDGEPQAAARPGRDRSAGPTDGRPYITDGASGTQVVIREGPLVGREGLTDAPGEARIQTLGEAVGEWEDALLVGREQAVIVFRRWLAAQGPVPEILNVHGPGGVGKSTLLRLFARIAGRLGIRAVLADARDFPLTPEGLLAALAPVPAAEAVDHLNRTRPLLLLDTCEELAALNGYLLETLLPALRSDVKLAIAGRYPATQVWGEASPWSRNVRPLPLSGFSPAQSREYLRRRGLADPVLVEQAVSSTAGSPLALSLAADLALQLGVRDLHSAPQWRAAVRGLVEQLLREVGDAELGTLLEAGSVVRQFDQPTLAALAGTEDVKPAFARLCQLSVVRPAEHGLALHDDVRRLLAEDLRWRDPQRHAELRRRAVAHYRRRMRSAPTAIRERLTAECLFLLGNGLLQTLMFHEAPPGEVWTEPARAADHPEIRHIWARWLKSPDIGGTVDRTQELEAILAYPDTRLRIAWGRGRRALGFSATLPVCRESLPLLAGSRATAALVRCRWGGAEGAALPETAEGSAAFVFGCLAHLDDREEAVRAVLLRDMLSLLAHNGTYYVPASIPVYRALAETLGFRPVGAAREGDAVDAGSAAAYELDLSHVGFVAWVDGLIQGRPAARRLRGAELVRELQAALSCWHDDARLARSRMCAHLAIQRPAALRQVVLQALERARSRGGEAERPAFRALELAYLQPGAASAAEAAGRLGVSRATFYRLVKRGIQGLAAVLEAERRR